MTVDLVKRIVAALLFTVLVLPPLLGWIAVRRMRRRPPPAPTQTDADAPRGDAG